MYLVLGFFGVVCVVIALGALANSGDSGCFGLLVFFVACGLAFLCFWGASKLYEGSNHQDKSHAVVHHSTIHQLN